jgi:hypothetical protein
MFTEPQRAQFTDVIRNSSWKFAKFWAGKSFRKRGKGRCGNSPLHLAVRVGKGSRKNLLTACFTVRRVNGRESAAGARQMVVRAPQGAADGRESAPQARQMVARGEREARSPWNVRKRSTGLDGRQKRARVSVAPAGLARFLSVIQGQRARCARTCPWLPSAAPAALRTLRAPPAALRNPGYHLPRLRRFGTLATI